MRERDKHTATMRCELSKQSNAPVWAMHNTNKRQQHRGKYWIKGEETPNKYGRKNAKKYLGI